MRGPLLTLKVVNQLRSASLAGSPTLTCSLDLDRSATSVGIEPEGWSWNGATYPIPEDCNDRTIYRWHDGAFRAVARFSTALIKLVPTDWGPPTFEIDGIKMLPTLRLSPYEDASQKVGLVRPRGKRILDTCGGLGYFAAWCLAGHAAQIVSFEKNADVLWLREINPWSPSPDPRLRLSHTDCIEGIATLPDRSVEAILHDPPRFGIAGELYSLAFYEQLARVLERRGTLFHYTGSPNQNSRGRNLAAEVVRRLERAGFSAEPHGDGVLAQRL